METRKTRHGIRIVHGRHIVSELLAQPGPTHSVFDVLAASVAALSPGRDLTMLGFSGGGMLAPLRSLGRDDRVHGVDLDLSGARIFRRLARKWSGDVSVTRADAVDFLRKSTRRHACIVEDLSVQLANRDVQKPDVSFELMPSLIAKRLSKRGVAIFNLLPSDSRTWRELERGVMAPFEVARVVQLDDFENRVLLAGAALPDPWTIHQQLNAVLSLLGSKMAGTLHVRDRRA